MNYINLDEIDSAVLKKRIEHHLSYTLGDFNRTATTMNRRSWWEAVCMAVNDTIFQKMAETQARHNDANVRRIYYFSLEYLMGRLTANNLNNLGLYEAMRDALLDMDVELSDLLESAPDMALGNGGLGRLAACFIDSLATMDYPAIAYGIHYENGFFKQEIENGRQVERPDVWRDFGNPWELCRPNLAQRIGLYGQVSNITDEYGEISHDVQKLNCRHFNTAND